MSYSHFNSSCVALLLHTQILALLANCIKRAYLTTVLAPSTSTMFLLLHVKQAHSWLHSNLYHVEFALLLLLRQFNCRKSCPMHHQYTYGHSKEPQYIYRPQNVQALRMDDGSMTFLQITARSEEFQPGFAYTSGRIHTKNHPVAGKIAPPKTPDGAWVNGGGVRVEARVRLPQGTPTGTWPAFWMLPTDKVWSMHVWHACIISYVAHCAFFSTHDRVRRCNSSLCCCCTDCTH